MNKSKKIYNSQKKWVFLLVCSILTACSSSALDTHKKQNISDLFSQDSFKNTGELIRAPSVENYILSCCREKDDAIALMEQDGYKIFSNNRINHSDFFTKYSKQLDIRDGDVETVYATKQKPFAVFFPDTYRIRLYIDEQDKVSRVKAYIKSVPAP